MTDTTINARKFDGSVHRSWRARLVERAGDLLIFEGIFEKEVRHRDLGVIRRGTVSMEYYWLDRHYNVFQFFEPEGSPKCLYCNVNLPPVLSEGVLDYVDLDLDVLARPGAAPILLDKEEFEANARIFGYSNDLIDLSHKAVEEVLRLLGRAEPPFCFPSPSESL